VPIPRARRLLVLAELALAVALTALALTTAVRLSFRSLPLWRDEVSTLAVATMPRVADLLAFLDRESVPALYLLLLRAWTIVGGDGDASLRRLGLVLTLAALASVWLAARRFGGDVPLLALAFFAAHGFALSTLASIRSYGLGAVLMAVAVPLTWALLTRPGPGTFIAAALVFALAMQTLYTNAALVAALCLAAGAVAGVRGDRRAAGLVAGAGAIAGLTMLPYAGAVGRSMVWRPLHETSFGPSDLLVRWLTAFAAADLRLAGVWLAVAAVGLGGAVALLRSRAAVVARPRVAYAAAAAILTTVMHLGLIAASRRLPSYWHFVALMAPVAIALDAIFAERVGLRWMRLGLVAAAAPVLMGVAAERSDTRRTNLDAVAAHLTIAARAGDVIVVNPWAAAPTLTRYYRGAAPIVTLPPMADLEKQRPDLLRERLAAPAPLTPLHEAMESALRRGDRVWLVGDLTVPPPGQRPIVLPPAPAAPTGWAEAPYQDAWTMQTGDMLRRHAIRWRPIDLPAPQPVDGMERLRFGVVEGWRD
jgi:hypothetical protein